MSVYLPHFYRGAHGAERVVVTPPGGHAVGTHFPEIAHR